MTGFPASSFAPDSALPPAIRSGGIGGIEPSVLDPREVRLVDAAERITSLRYTLFDSEAFEKELGGLLRLALAGADGGGIISSWVHHNAARLKHPERDAFLDDIDWAEEFEAFSVGEYARFALTAYCEPEATHRMGDFAAYIVPWLREHTQSTEETVGLLIGDLIESQGQVLQLSTRLFPAILPAHRAATALHAGRALLKSMHDSGASQRVLAIRASASPAAESDRLLAAQPSDGATLRPSQRRPGLKAIRRAVETWLNTLDEAVDVGVGLLTLFELPPSLRLS